MSLEEFKGFIGREVEVSEENKSIHLENLGTTHKYTQYHLSNGDATILELEKTASAKGLKLRTWLPSSVGDCAYRTNRLNVHIEKDEKGIWRIERLTFG